MISKAIDVINCNSSYVLIIITPFRKTRNGIESRLFGRHGKYIIVYLFYGTPIVLSTKYTSIKNRAETSVLSLISVNASHSQKHLSSCILPQPSLRNCTSLRYKYSFYL